ELSKRGRSVALARRLRERASTAAGLLALNREWGENFYRVPESATQDEVAAAEAFQGRGIVIDVQTHFMAPHALRAGARSMLPSISGRLRPDGGGTLNEVVAWNPAEYIQKIFIETEPAVAILTSGPGLEDADRSRFLFNHEMAATRALLEGLAGS